MGLKQRRNIWFLVVLVGAVCVIHEALQLADNFNSGYQGRIYSVQNNDELHIFFHNRNHLAALLYSTIPIATYLHTSDSKMNSPIGWVVYVVFNILIVIGLAMTLSRSALGLGMLAWGLSYIFLLRRYNGSGRMPTVGKVLVGLVAFLAAIVVALSFGLDVIFARLASSGSSDQARWVLNRLSFALVSMFWPIGSGLGTFERVFPLVQSSDTIFPAIVNHAHNDFIELVIETGVFGATIVILFFGAVIKGAGRIFERVETVSRQEGSAAIIVCGLLSMHSIWDYPLRTSALSVVFAVACAAITVASSPRSCAPSDLRP